MPSPYSAEVERLYAAAEDALQRRDWATGAHRESTERRLLKLAQAAPDGSEPWRFALHALARADVESRPWRASLLARRLLDQNAHDAAAWGVLGLSQSLLGQYAYAKRAYRRALALDPGDPWVAHNLGHLLDAIDDAPGQALPYLRRAYQRLGGIAEIGASYAHALARAGKPWRARGVMRAVLRQPGGSDHEALQGWIVELCEAAIAEALPSEAPPNPRGRRKRRRTVVL